MKLQLQPKRTTQTLSRWGMILLFSVFLLVGLVAGWFLLVQPVRRVWEAREWPAVRCTVVSSRVRSHDGRDSTTYSVHIVYRYTVNGRAYQSDRYDFMVGSSSGYEGKQAIVNRYPPGKEAICYVNPRDPSDAVLERRATPLMLLALFPFAFLGVGAAGLMWTLSNPSLQKRIRGVPLWESRADWAEGRLVHSTRPAMLVAWVIALTVNLAVATVIFLFWEQWPAVWGLALLGAAAVWVALYLTRRWRKYGESIFELATRPGAVGGTLAGTLHLRQFVRFDNGLKFSVRCVRIISTGKSTSEEVLWSDEQTVPADGTDTVSVNFYIPTDCLETNPDEGITWRLEARAADYSAQFEVPVFKVAQEGCHRSGAEAARAAKEAALAAYERPVDSPIRVEPLLEGGAEFRFPALRHPGAVIGVIGFLAGGIAGLVILVAFRAPLLLIVLFGLVELAVLMLLGGLWFSATTTTVRRDTMTVARKTFGWRRKRDLPVTDVKRFKLLPAIFGTTTYYVIAAELRNGRTRWVSGWIKERLEAEWLAREMSRCAGLEPAK